MVISSGKFSCHVQLSEQIWIGNARGWQAAGHGWGGKWGHLPADKEVHWPDAASQTVKPGWDWLEVAMRYPVGCQARAIVGPWAGLDSKRGGARPCCPILHPSGIDLSAAGLMTFCRQHAHKGSRPVCS